MDAFRRESTNYRFDLNLRNKKDLVVSVVGQNLADLNKYDFEPGYTEYGFNKGLPFGLAIENFLERIKTPEASSIIQMVLSAFYHTFKPRKDQREQLRRGLRYFSLAEHYKVLDAAFPQEMLDGVRSKYEELAAKLDSLEHEYVITQQMVQKFHINDPLIASTGLIVYATLNHNWFIYETDQRHDTLPEYLFGIIHHNDFKLATNLTNVFTGTQNACLQYVRDKQKDIYGVSLDEYRSLEKKISGYKKLADDFEILLDMPISETISGKSELAEREQQLNDSVDVNLHHLNLMSEEGETDDKQ